MSKSKFRIGELTATPGVLGVLAVPGEARAFLARHASGDWGEVDAHDRRANEHALRHGMRLLSAYTTASGERIWIITEADRSSTCLLLPEKY